MLASKRKGIRIMSAHAIGHVHEPGANTGEYLWQHRTIRLRHLPENPRPDFVTFSCNTQSIPAKNCLHQNVDFLGICSCRIMRCCPIENAQPPNMKKRSVAARNMLSCDQSAALIFSIISAYSASLRKTRCGFIAKTPPYSKPPSYFGTRCMCRWQPVSP